MRPKYLLYIISFLFSLTPLTAQTVDEGQARRVATHFAQSVGMKNEIALGHLQNLTRQTPFREFYTFVGSDGHGFVLVSREQSVTPVLACSEQGIFLVEQIPAPVLEWLQDYEAQIRYCREHQLPASPDIAARWQQLSAPTSPTPSDDGTIPPMLTTTWGQGTPYNTHCPLYNETQHSETGCVATALAQVMNWWQWPVHGRGNAATSRTSGSTTVTYTAQLADTLFDWDNMANDLRVGHTTAQAEAVATLMYNAGLAVQMSYGQGSSANTTADGGTGAHSAEEALRNHFYYSPHVTSVKQSDHTDAEWHALLRQEIESGRPVIYSGRSSSYGHAFVLDGCNAAGQFHVNWGFYGYDNGYYTIGALNPAFMGGEFNMLNAAIIGIQPDTVYADNGQTTVTVLTSNASHGSVTGGGTYNNYASTIQLTATPNNGYHFKMWSDGCRYNPRRLVATGGEQTYTAVFATDVVTQGDQISYCATDGSFSGGYAQPSVQEWGIRIPYTSLVNSQYLDQISFATYHSYGGTGTCYYTVRVYRGGNNPNEGTLVFETPSPISTQHNTWHTLQLSGGDTVHVDHVGRSCLWITLASASNNRTIATNPTANRDGFWTKFNSGNWGQASYSQRNTAYPIRAHFSAVITNPVSALSIMDTTDTSALAIWHTPSGGQATDYTVAWGTGLIPELMTTATTADTSFQLSQLESNTRYHVYVKARYAAVNGYSDWQQVTFRTSAATEPTRDTVYVHDTTQYCHQRTLALLCDATQGICAGAGTFNLNTTCQALAIPLSGYRFIGWSDGNTENPRTLILSQDITLTAQFQPTTSD